MKKTNSQKFQLGVFVLISSILFVTLIYFIGQGQNMFKKTYTLSTYFQNVNGLQRGNNVHYSGINIGVVSEVLMINDTTIKVSMGIDEKAFHHIKKNAIATIGSDGLVGNRIVNIVPGKGNATPVNNKDVIPSFSKIGADDILNTLSATNENAAILVADLLKITHSISNGKGTLGVLLNDTIMANDLKISVKNLKAASYRTSQSMKELNEFITKVKHNNQTVLGVLVNDTLSGAKLKSTIAHLEKSGEEINELSKKANTLLDKLNSPDNSINYISQDSTLTNQLKSIIENIDQGTDKFNQNMEALKHSFLTRKYFKKEEKKNTQK